MPCAYLFRMQEHTTDRPRPTRQRVRIVVDAPERVEARNTVAGKPYTYARTPDSFYERGSLSAAELVKRLRSDAQNRDSRDEYLLSLASSLPDPIALVRVTKWTTDGAKTERRDYVLVDGGVVFDPMVPPVGYAPREPARFK